MSEPLLDVATLKKGPEAVKELLSQGADVSARNDKGETPLHLSCTLTRPAVTELLLEAGADVNAQDSEGCTPLHWAVRLHRRWVLKQLEVLTAHGADPTIKNSRGQIPAKVALAEEASKYLRKLKRTKAPKTKSSFRSLTDEEWESLLRAEGLFYEDHLNHDGPSVIGDERDFVVHAGDIDAEHFRPFGVNVVILGDLRCRYLDGRAADFECCTITVKGNVVCDALQGTWEQMIVIGGNLEVSSVMSIGHHGSTVIVQGDLAADALFCDEGELEVAGKRSVHYDNHGNATPFVDHPTLGVYADDFEKLNHYIDDNFKAS